MLKPQFEMLSLTFCFCAHTLIFALCYFLVKKSVKTSLRRNEYSTKKTLLKLSVEGCRNTFGGVGPALFPYPG